jgi:acetolactate synthase-1/2/3 large subunit
MASGGVTGAQRLVAALDSEGIRTVFGTVGHGNLAFVDALLDSSIKYVPVLHEQVAAHAADAYFRASGEVAVVTTTVGPGFTNLATGLGDALLDSSALVVITGGVPSEYIGREALQELTVHGDDEQPLLFRPLAKRVIRVQRPAELAHRFHEAVQRAQDGCPGPVIMHVPMDFFSAPAGDEPDVFHAVRPQRIGADQEAIALAAEVLAGAERPLIFAGGGAIVSRAGAEITAMAEEFGIPVVTSMSGQGAIDETNPLALGFTGVVGSRPANQAARNCDVLIAIGTRFPEMDASSWRADSFVEIPPARLIHIDVDVAQINKVYPATVALIGDARRTAAELREAMRGVVDSGKWTEWRVECARARQEWADDMAPLRTDTAFPYEPAHLLTRLRDLIPDAATLVTGVGIRHAVGQHLPIRRERSHIVASGFGTMGQEMSAPIGARYARPDHPVVAVVGDGAFMACLAAVPTAVMDGCHVVWVVLNNGGYGSIAIYQAKHFGRHHGTWFRQGEAAYDVSYAEIARSFGARGVRVEAPDQLDAAMATALNEPAPWVIEVPVTATPRVQASGHWDVNDVLAMPRLAAQA